MDACYCMTLRRAARRISQSYDEALATAGVRVAQFSILATLSARDAWSVHELAQKLELDPTTMGKNLRPLERDGLVRTEVDAHDRRGRRITLTEDGRRTLQAAAGLWDGAQKSFEDTNGRKRVRQLREELAQLRNDA